ncbi:hypothetical protein [Parvibium lacunae]|uniref:hypothetical protein n=1 Tax=Parvibium lacunae TaxID=1888893 RepID=UPI0011C07061|nr:hypothetical protein [Parvibium lacunae]
MKSKIILTIWLLFHVSATFGSGSNCSSLEKNQIIPGHCVGKICLNMAFKDVEIILGKPTKKLLRQKHTISIWMSSNRKNFLFVVYDQAKLVSDIHLNSDTFSTCNRISVLSSFDDVSTAFSDGYEDHYSLIPRGHNRFDWIVKNEGITFTFSGDKQGKIIRIAVHRIGYEKSIGYSLNDDFYWYP